MATEYSKKRQSDTAGIAKFYVILYGAAWVLAIVSFVFAYLGGENENVAYDSLAYLLFAGAFVLAAVVGFLNYFQPEPRFLTYDEMVREKLDEYFKKINQESEGRSIQWNVVQGHYWLEIRMPTFRPVRFFNEPTHIPTVESQENAPTATHSGQPQVRGAQLAAKLAENEEKKVNDFSADRYPVQERDEGEFENEISKLVRNEDRDAVDGKNAAMQGGILAKDM